MNRPASVEWLEVQNKKALGESIKNQTSYSLQLTQHVMHRNQGTNLVISPLSIHVILSLIAAGSQGETLNQLLSLLRAQTTEELNSLSSELVASVLADGGRLGGPVTSCANGVWIHNNSPLKPSFRDVVNNVYRAFVNQVDFQAKADEITSEVNSWAEKETRGLIKEILPARSVDRGTKLILANALYFKGAWNEKFDTSQTREYEFHLLNGTSVQVPFMTSTKKQRLSEYDGFKVLGLPYKQGEDKRRLSMYFILPDAKDGLPALVDKVASEPGFLDRHLRLQYVPVGKFRIPKFKISFGFEASEVLKGLGLVAPFYGGLTEMVDSPEAGRLLCVSKIFHKSFIEVDEEGTEAAAVSAAVMFFGSSRMTPVAIDFVADHPFMFLIREDMTGVVVFIGHVLNPTLSS